MNHVIGCAFAVAAAAVTALVVVRVAAYIATEWTMHFAAQVPYIGTL